MNTSLCLVLAAGLTGSNGPACPCNQNATGSVAPTYVQPRVTEGGVRGWLRNALGRSPSYSSYAAKPALQPSVVQAPSVPAEPPLMNTVVTASATEKVVAVKKESPETPDLQVAKKYEDRVGHEQDYTWVTGHLFFVHADGGRWIVRYALPDEVDKYGGSIVLAAGVEMKNFREGDLVCVQGEVLDEARTSRSLGGALYRVNAINMVDRSDP